MGFIDTLRSQGHAVESICRVLREQDCQVAARTYRAWRARRGPAERTVSDAHVIHAIRSACYDADGKLTAEGLYGRRKMTAYLRRHGLPDVAYCTVDRCMKTLGYNGVRRGKAVRTTIPNKDGVRAGDLLNRDFSAPAPNRVWVTDFTYVRTWAGFCYVAFIVDVYAQKIVAVDLKGYITLQRYKYKDGKINDEELRKAFDRLEREMDTIPKNRVVIMADTAIRNAESFKLGHEEELKAYEELLRRSLQGSPAAQEQ